MEKPKAHIKAASPRMTAVIRLTEEDQAELQEVRHLIGKLKLGKLDLTASLLPTLREVLKDARQTIDAEILKRQKEE